MALKTFYQNLNDVPENYRDLFTETSDGVRLTGVEGMKTEEDVSKVQEALRKEREDHKASKAKLSKLGDLDPDDVLAKLDRFDELEAAAKGKVDDDKIEEIVERRLKTKTAPLERRINELTTERDELSGRVGELGGELTKRDRSGSVRQVAQEMNILSTAIPDLELAAEFMLERTEDGQFVVKDGAPGLTPGLDVKGFLQEMQRARPHWWPQSEGGGAKGGGPGTNPSDNPFSAKNWNLTKQGQVYRQDPQEAQRLAKLAGTTIGGAMPAK